jgi:hypothetical protein
LCRRLISVVIVSAMMLCFLSVSLHGQGKGKGSKPHPHIHKAIKDLKHTKTQLEKAKPIYNGHRNQAIKDVEKALHQLHKALESVSK